MFEQAALSIRLELVYKFPSVRSIKHVMRMTLLECKIDPSTVLYASGSSSATRKTQQVTSLRFLFPAIFPSFFNRMHTEQVKKPS
jgi:hypothetical protein